MPLLITRETLRKWNACEAGYKRFCELLPYGASLQDASKALIDDCRADWADWLWFKCRNDSDYVDQTVVVSGDYGTATAGYHGTATAGDRGTARAGDRGTATAGDCGTATAVYYGTATAGYRGTATAGYHGTATAGDQGTATAGDHGTARAGMNGAIIIRNHKSPYQLICAQVDGEIIKANVFYKLNDNAQFVEAK